MAPRYRFAAAPADLATLIFFILQGALTAYCIVYLQRARHTAVQGQQQLSRLHELSARLFEEKNFDQMLRKVLSAAMELLKSEKSFIQLYDEHTRMLSAIAQVGFTPDFLYQFDRVPIDFSSCGAAVQRKQRVIIGNIALDPEFSQLTPVFSRFGVVAVQSTPLFNTNGQVLGVLSTYFSMPHVSSTEDLRFLDLYAHQAERVLEAKRTEEALRGTNRDLERRAIKNSQQLIEKDKRLRDLFVELVGTEERERRHLAEELHDYLAQLLTFARIKLRQAQQCLHGPVGDSDRHLSETDDALKKSIDYARTLMAELCPPELRESGLPAALRWLAGQMPKHGLSVDFSAGSEPLPLPNEQAVLLFQSVRELLMNVVKHAAVTQATLSLMLEAPDMLRITVQDHGPGFNPAAVGHKATRDHFGLSSIQERMTFMGGRLDIDSHSGGGTAMTLLVPLDPSNDAASLRAASSPPQDRVKAKPTGPVNQESLPLE